ncbi:MAG: hypothetical protein ACYDBQ_04140 [Thermoplasmatota archaeon]
MATLSVASARPQTAQVLRHILWHKALVADDDDGARFDHLIEVVSEAGEGEHVSLRDPFHRDIAIAFELVMRADLDPWDLDLSKFAALYLVEADKRDLDIEMAGRIILMAWAVLKLQSDDLAQRAVFVPPTDAAPAWEDLPAWEFGEGWDFAQRVLSLPESPIDEKIRHKGDRRVTLMELVNAFAEVHSEAVARKVLVQQKLEARLSLSRRMRGRVGGMMHKEDLHVELEETWTRLVEVGTSPVPFRLLHEPNALDLVQTFATLLILIKDGCVEVRQEDFPRGDIWVTPIRAPASGPKEGENQGMPT